MNDLDKIFKLVEAGYSKAEIDLMLKPEEQPDITDPEVTKEEAKTETTAEPEKAADLQNDYLKTMREITDEFKKIRDDLHRSNLIVDGTEIQNPLEESRKVLAAIIDPPNPTERS